MKKVFILLFAVLLAAVTALANHHPSIKANDDPLLYWFDANGDFIDQEYFSVMHQLCPNNGDVCAQGYTGTDEVEGKIVPSGNLEKTVRFQ